MAKKRVREEAHVRLGRALEQHMSADFDAFGADLIAQLRTEKPVEYMKLLNNILAGAERQKPSAPTHMIVERRIVEPGDPEFKNLPPPLAGAKMDDG